MSVHSYRSTMAHEFSRDAEITLPHGGAAQRHRRVEVGTCPPDQAERLGMRHRHKKMHPRTKRVMIPLVRERDGDDCLLCGKPLIFATGGPLSATVEHIVPLSRGGCHAPVNLALTHYQCNMNRGDLFIGAEMHVPAPQWICRCGLPFREWLQFSSHHFHAHHMCPHEGCGAQTKPGEKRWLHEWECHGVLPYRWIEGAA